MWILSTYLHVHNGSLPSENKVLTGEKEVYRTQCLQELPTGFILFFHHNWWNSYGMVIKQDRQKELLESILSIGKILWYLWGFWWAFWR